MLVPPDSIIDADSVATAILEKLWQHASRRGFVGEYDNEVIAEICGWRGDADELVGMLISSGWVDVSDEHYQLSIHLFEIDQEGEE